MSMSIQVLLRVDDATEYVHRFQNLGEDLHRGLYGVATLDLETVDAATDRFTVTGIRRRDLGRVVQRMKKLVRQSGFEDQVDLIREDGRRL